jgi:hypothetical protein
MEEKRKPKIYEGCDKWRIYEYMDIVVQKLAEYEDADQHGRLIFL